MIVTVLECVENFFCFLIPAGISILWDTMLKTDLSVSVPELQIPVYFVHGVYDYTVSYNLAKEYFNILKAPVKEFYTFDYSAHSPLFEEPAKMNGLMEKIVEK
jgi:pimeloyl-ACP methyl ester carboxylesterase